MSSDFIKKIFFLAILEQTAYTILNKQGVFFMTVYERIKLRRIELGMSQADLGKKIGYTNHSTIAKIESGQRDLKQSQIVKFAKALDTTPGYLMGWEDLSHINEDELTAELIALGAQMTPEQRARAVAYMQGMLDNS